MRNGFCQILKNYKAQYFLKYEKFPIKGGWWNTCYLLRFCSIGSKNIKKYKTHGQRMAGMSSEDKRMR